MFHPPPFFNIEGVDMDKRWEELTDQILDRWDEVDRTDECATEHILLEVAEDDLAIVECLLTRASEFRKAFPRSKGK